VKTARSRSAAQGSHGPRTARELSAGEMGRLQRSGAIKNSSTGTKFTNTQQIFTFLHDCAFLLSFLPDQQKPAQLALQQ